MTTRVLTQHFIFSVDVGPILALIAVEEGETRARMCSKRGNSTQGWRRKGRERKRTQALVSNNRVKKFKRIYKTFFLPDFFVLCSHGCAVCPAQKLAPPEKTEETKLPTANCQYTYCAAYCISHILIIIITKLIPPQVIPDRGYNGFGSTIHAPPITENKIYIEEENSRFGKECCPEGFGTNDQFICF
jgi:hypothetical protein